MVAIAGGDRDALAALYDRYAPRMLALGVRMLGRRSEAEDILHDVFVEVWKRAGDYRPARGAVTTWLLLRMRSRCLDRLRRADFSRTDSLAAVPDDGPVVAVAAGDAGARVSLETALGELPTHQRQIILLGYFGGLTSPEIARRLGIPIGTVKSRRAAAIDRLRARLAEPPEEVA